MADLFISYAREDYVLAEVLARAASGHGLTTWWDHKLNSGENFRSKIEQEIDEAACVAVLWSRASINSHFVLDEADKALRQGKLCPFLIDDCDPPMGFRNVNYKGISKISPDIDAFVENVSNAVRKTSHKSSALAPADRQMSDLRYWAEIESSGDVSDLQLYLDEFPQGVHAALARLKIKRLLSEKIVAFRASQCTPGAIGSLERLSDWVRLLKSPASKVYTNEVAEYINRRRIDRRLTELHLTSSPVAIACSCDGARIHCVCADGAVLQWINTEAMSSAAERFQSPISSASILMCGGPTVGVHADGAISLFDSSLKKPKPLQGYSDRSICAEFAMNGRFILSGGTTGTIGVWRGNGTFVKVLRGHNSGIKAIGIDNSREMAISVSRDRVMLWNLSNLEPLHTTTLGEGRLDVGPYWAQGKNFHLVIVDHTYGQDEGWSRHELQIKPYSLDDATTNSLFPDFKEFIKCLAVDEDRSLVFFSTRTVMDRKTSVDALRIYNPSSRQLLDASGFGAWGDVKTMSVSGDGRTLIAGATQTITSWDISDIGSSS